MGCGHEQHDRRTTDRERTTSEPATSGSVTPSGSAPRSLLAEAAGRGHLDLAQLDARLAAVWAAGTRAELAAVEADLPASLRADRDRRERAERARHEARAGLGRHLGSYLAVMALLVGIWLVAGLSGAGWYPWPLWPALGWGFAVVGQVRTARAPVG
jgi:hypothetical protein